MLATLTLIVLVSSGEGSAQLALHDAAAAVLGQDASVSVRMASPLPSDEALPELLAAEHADALATVSWLDPERRRAAVHVYRGEQRDFVRREIEFAPTDGELEKARTLGLAIASTMTKERAAENAAQPAPEQPGRAPAAASPPDAQTREPLPAPAPAKPIEPSPAAPAREPPHPDAEKPVAPESPKRALAPSIDLAGGGLLALGGGAGTRAGGELGVELAARHFGMRLDLGMSLGRIAPLDASLAVLDLAPGVVWLSSTSPAEDPLALELRLSFAARYLGVSRKAEPAHPAEQHARWLPAARLGAAGMFWFSSEFALLADVGVDCSFGETTLSAMGAQVASIEPFALFLQLGVRALL